MSLMCRREEVTSRTTSVLVLVSVCHNRECFLQLLMLL